MRFWEKNNSVKFSDSNLTKKRVIKSKAIEPMLNNYEMSSVCVDTGVMWRLSEDFNRRFVARVQQQSHHLHSHHHHHHHHRPGSMTMLYNGKVTPTKKNPLTTSFIYGLYFFVSIFIRGLFLHKIFLTTFMWRFEWVFRWNLVFNLFEIKVWGRHFYKK